MDKQTTLKGMWWVKGNENDKFTGILTYGAGYVPTLEIFPKEFDWDKQKVPNNSTVYGDVFGESRKIQAVTLLECTSENSFGHFDVGAYIYKQEFVFANCVAIGMHLDDDEIAQVQSPENIYLTCPGLDEFSIANTVDYVWKDNIPKGRAYRTGDLERIIYTPLEPIVIEIDIGTITISLRQSGSSRGISSHYLIGISLENPTPQAEVNSLIYAQLLSFLSIMTGRREYIKTHNVSIDSEQTRSDSLSLELNYGQIAQSTQESDYSILQALLIGREENMRKFATLFPKWRENFTFVEDLTSLYFHLTEQSNEINMLQAFFHIEAYVLKRLPEKKSQSVGNILKRAINFVADSFPHSSVYLQNLPADRRDHIAEQLANFRNERVHRRRNKDCIFAPEQVYAYIDVILRSIFLKEMEYCYDDIDREIQHWQSWHQLDGE